MNSEVYCVEYFHAKPGCGEALKLELRAIAEKSKLEDGCLQYDVLVEKNNPNVFILILKYKDESAISAHEKQPYVVSFAESKMNELCEKVYWHDAVAIF